MANFTTYGKTFEVPDRYQAGHAITENEAKALNTLMGELISHRVRSQVELAKGEVMPDDVAAKMQEFVTQAAGEFEFGAGRTASGEPRVVDPVQREARAIARRTITEMVKAKGWKVGKKGDAETAEETGEGIYPFSKFQEKVGEAMKTEKVQAAARAAVKAAQKGGLDESELQL